MKLLRMTCCPQVREEVSIEIADIRYIASQNWPFPHSLMLGFHAQYVSGEIIPQPDEIEDAGLAFNAPPLLCAKLHRTLLN